MARKGSERLRNLLKLAAMKEQTAARQLAASSEQLQQAQRQSRELTLYHREYESQYLDRGQQTLKRGDLLNYQGFFRQLEHAQVQQTLAIQQRDLERERARAAWLALYAKRRLLAQVRVRRLARELREEEQKLQRELDDRAARKLHERR
jgi:flagellar FliJ protein